MSAGSINLAKTAVCSLACGHFKQEIYPALGCVNLSVEPHFAPDDVPDELLDLSVRYPLYGLCDGSIILCAGEKIRFYSEVCYLFAGKVIRLDS